MILLPTNEMADARCGGIYPVADSHSRLRVIQSAVSLLMIRQSYWSRSTFVRRFEPATGVLSELFGACVADIWIRRGKPLCI